ncbi:hypothetical protein [Propioniciclava flava]|uniref:Uncharacterized protein n=1 Tax=Propioniciclava flava TaxID=2072026 RepID=A0A4Q2EFZ1_9ACTN|nr:hypothetical protein [Propioniciclava flava]RXW31462.1 hypothetical protein C1706_11300 [Propioniciclava flava]
MGAFACCDGERLHEADRCLLVFVDVDAGGEGLVREAFPVGVGALVEALAVDQEPQCLRDLAAGALILVVFILDAAVDIGQACADAVLVTFQGGEVDGVSEVCGEELVGLIFEPPAVGSEFCQFVGASREALVECLLDFLGEADVLGFVQRPAHPHDQVHAPRNPGCGRRTTRRRLPREDLDQR